MKRAFSILLAALLLLVAVPAVAEEKEPLQAGLYIAEDSTDVLYLDERGCGVLNYDTGEQDLANGVLWTADTLEIERKKIPFAVMGRRVIFTYDNAVRIFHYAGEGEEYAMGDQENMSFAGTYLNADGRKLILTVDGEGVYTDDNGETPIFWGTLLPYWRTTEGMSESVCYVLFDSYLSSMDFADDAVAVHTEKEGTVTLGRQAQAKPAGDGQIYYGYQMNLDGQSIDLIPFLTGYGRDPRSIYMELRSDGTGHIQIMDEDNASDFTWTEDTITVDGESAPYTRVGDHIVLNMEGESIEFIPEAEFEAMMGNDVGTGNEPVAEADPLVGTWTFSKVRTMGLEVPASMMGTNLAFVFNADGTAAMISDGSTTDLEWAWQDESTVALSVAGSVVYTLAYNGTELNWITGAEGVDMIFEKDM